MPHNNPTETIVPHAIVIPTQLFDFPRQARGICTACDWTGPARFLWATATDDAAAHRENGCRP